jgi:hypothetical protein
MIERPKSREETPKEGSETASEEAIAPQQYDSALHKKQAPVQAHCVAGDICN